MACSHTGAPPPGRYRRRGAERRRWRTRIKICGITRIEDAAAAAAAGVDAVGFVFISSSPRAVTYAAAGRIVETLPPFVTPSACSFDLQRLTFRRRCVLPGLRSPRCLTRGDRTEDGTGSAPPCGSRGTRLRPFHAPRMGMPEYLLDTHVEGLTGGTGQTFDWSVAAEAARYARIVLAGALLPEMWGGPSRLPGPLGLMSVPVSRRLRESSRRKRLKLLRRLSGDGSLTRGPIEERNQCSS